MPLDHSSAPLVDAVRAYREDDIVPFTTPGHKRGTGLDPLAAAALGRDVDDTHTTRGVLLAAERLAADAFGADRTFFLLNGSSIGNQASLLATVAQGDDIIVARNVHKSVLTALILSGARPIYVAPRYDPELEIAHGLDPADVAAALEQHPGARAVVVVSPSYFGVASDLPAMAALCHQRGVPLIVDEAWAPHFSFHPGFPMSAMQAGADIGIASIHKVLTGFTQSAVLNLREGRIDSQSVARWLDLLQTTSPSALMLASIDACRRQMALNGVDLLERTLALSDQARALLAALPGVGVMGDEVVGRPGAAALDRTKLVIDVQGLGISGYQADEWLRAQHGITVEMSDHRRVVALLSIADTAASVRLLTAAIEALVGLHRRSIRPTGQPCFDPAGLQTESVLTPAEAARARSRPVPLPDAAGHISADVVTPYPPGIPVLAPGERVTQEIITYLQAALERGLQITGATDETLATLRVVL
jgi:arginine/lysine/ornithine decarboxylase